MNGDFRSRIHHQNALKAALLKQPFQREFYLQRVVSLAREFINQNALVGAVGPSGWRIKHIIP